MRGVLSIFVGVTALLVSSLAAATVIDFEDLGVVSGTQLNPAINTPQDSGGFTFSSTGADLHFHNQDGIGDNGSTHMGAHGFVSFAPSGGGTFSLNSFSFDYFVSDLGSVDVIGTLFGGGTVMQSFATDGTTNSYQTLVLNGLFVNLTDVTIDTGAANLVSTNGFFVDDILVNAVPEPGTFALVGLALAGIGFSRRRKL